MANTTEKPTAAQLRTQVQQAEGALESKKAEWSKTLQAAENAGVEAIVTGKRSQAPALLARARQLEQEVEALTASLQTLSKALSLVEAEEAAAAEQAERARVTHLTGLYRDAVGKLIQTIEAGNDAMAPYRIQQAEAALAAISFQMPARARPPQFVVQNPSMIVVDEQMRLGFFELLCNAGFSDLFPKEHLARRRFEHQQAHERSENARIARQQAQCRATAESALIPDDMPTIPDRRPKFTYL